MSLKRSRDPEALYVAAAADLAGLVEGAVRARGRCHIALAGGSTPRRLYQRLATMALPWDRIELWWGDERAVPPDHQESNYRMVQVALLDVIGPTQVAGIHRIAGECDPSDAADACERDLVGALGIPPVLDVVLLGLGTDAHTASLFPGTTALTETVRWVVANPVPLSGTTRITMTAKTLRAGRHVRFLVAGADKAPAMAAVLEGPRDPDRYPAQLVTTAETDVVWLVDDAAASQLVRTP